MNIGNDTSAVLAQMHNSITFEKHIAKVDDVKANTKQVEAELKEDKQYQQSVDNRIKTDENKFSQEHDAQVRKNLIAQLNSPFPSFSTETRLKAL
jgi:hypothetical protein